LVEQVFEQCDGDGSMKCSCGMESQEVCQDMFHAVSIREMEGYASVTGHRKTVDIYSLQHPEPYMVSVKSFAAHLLGLCIVMDYNGDPNLFKALEQWGYGKEGKGRHTYAYLCLYCPNTMEM
jgi:hypothetical protein